MICKICYIISKWQEKEIKKNHNLFSWFNKLINWWCVVLWIRYKNRKKSWLNRISNLLLMQKKIKINEIKKNEKMEKM